MDWSLVKEWDSSSWAQLRSPLGAHWHNGRVTFAVFSKHATRVALELFDTPTGHPAKAHFVLRRCADDVHRGTIEGLPVGALYGYRCWGPNWVYDAEWVPGRVDGFLTDVDNRGNRFNPNKLLIDPYARELSHDRESPETKAEGHHAAMYGSGPEMYAGFGHPPVVRRAFDTGPWAPKSVVVHDQTSFGVKPRVLQKDAVIYEAHVRGLTKHPSASRLTDILAGLDGFDAVVDVPEAYRGTYRGAALMAPYLRGLGVTTVEFLPVHETANDLNTEDVAPDRTELEAPHGNYWGYMTYAYFAPDRRYAYDRSFGGPTREFKAMVRAFHSAGLEVYLDVVYNHTAEGGLWDGDPATAEVLSWRGLDNSTYYALTGDGNRFYWESTGCGNNLNCSESVVQKLICDSLEYWANEMGVDGFRFDLATVLGRDALFGYEFRAGSELLKQIALIADVYDLEVIAEAWDTAESDLGAFPRGWAEWNGRFRDVVRRFLRGDPGQIREFMDTVNGDYHVFSDQGGPHKSVNLVDAHDGFTLLDLVSYNSKNNRQKWPFGPSDGGADENLSWDSNGDQALRRQRMRNFLVVQVFSRGVPMLVGGDEFARTQNGNNNPYKIDSIGIWQNYAAIATNSPTAIATEGPGAYHDNFGTHRSRGRHNGWFLFVQRLLHLRRDHVALRQDRYGDFEANAGNDVSMFFLRADGSMRAPLNEHVVQWHLDGSAVGDRDFLVLINVQSVGQEFNLAAPDLESCWKRMIDTAAWAEPENNLWDPTGSEQPRFGAGSSYWVHPHSIVVFSQQAW